MTFPTPPLPSRLDLVTRGHAEYLELQAWLALHPQAQTAILTQGRYPSEWLHTIYVSQPVRKQAELL